MDETPFFCKPVTCSTAMMIFPRLIFVPGQDFHHSAICRVVSSDRSKQISRLRLGANDPCLREPIARQSFWFAQRYSPGSWQLTFPALSLRVADGSVCFSRCSSLTCFASDWQLEASAHSPQPADLLQIRRQRRRVAQQWGKRWARPRGRRLPHERKPRCAARSGKCSG